MGTAKNKAYVGKTFSNSQEIVRAEYDFSKDGGAIGALDIYEAQDDVVILGAYLNVKTACTSTDAATLALGIDSDPDAIVDETAVASLALGALIAPVTNNPIKLASGSKVNFNIAAFALTAGKVEAVLVIAKF